MSVTLLHSDQTEPRGGPLQSGGGERQDGLLTALASALDGLADALAGEPGRKLQRYRGEGAIATFIQRVLALIIRALEALAAGMAKVEVWTRLADATIALLELFASSLATTATAGAELLATRGRLSEQSPASTPKHPLLATLAASGEQLGDLSRLVTEGAIEQLPDLDEVARIRRRLASLLEGTPLTSGIDEPAPATRLDRGTGEPARAAPSLVELLRHVTSTRAPRQL